jgi:hypothetical protein
LIPSRPFRLVLEGDWSIALDAAATVIALATPRFGLSTRIYGRVGTPATV